jgi:hypothetical protein
MAVHELLQGGEESWKSGIAQGDVAQGDCQELDRELLVMFDCESRIGQDSVVD